MKQMGIQINPGLAAEYAAHVDNNSDPYGSGVVRFEQRWADAMQVAMSEGATVAEAAAMTEHAADTEGITGFMYGCAVSSLSKFWVHGEELRQWHNIKTQIHDEGTKANESGGVLNPALLNVSVTS